MYLFGFFQLDAVKSEEVVPTILERKLARAQSQEERQELKSQIRRLYKVSVIKFSSKI